MKVTCSNCGAEVDVQGNASKCPYCGSVITCNQSQTDGVDNYFDNIAPQPSDAYVRSVDKNDKKLKKSVKNLFSWSVLLLVIGVLRLFTGFLTLETNEYIESQLPELIFDPISAYLSLYLSLSTAEIILHLFIAICGAVLVVFASKLKKIDIYSQDLQPASLKVFIVSCIMAVILVAYLIVEICMVNTMVNLIDVGYIEADSLTTTFSSLVWTVILVVGGALCVVESVRLAKQAKKN